MKERYGVKKINLNPKLLWVKLNDGGAPTFFELAFAGTLGSAVEHLQEMADRNEIILGQVIEADGKVYSNIVPRKK